MLAAFKEKIKGWKTIIWARALVLLGLVLTLISVMDVNALTVLLPDRYKPLAPMILVLIGLVTEALRRVTSGPVGSKGDEAPPPDTKAGD